MSGSVYEDLHVLIQPEKEVVLSFLLDGTLHSLSREASELIAELSAKTPLVNRISADNDESNA